MGSKWENLDRFIDALENADTAKEFSCDPEAVLGRLGINGHDRDVLRSLLARLGRMSRPPPVSILWPPPGEAQPTSLGVTLNGDGSHVFVAIIELTGVESRPSPVDYLPVRGVFQSTGHKERVAIPAPTLLPSDPRVLPTHAVFEFMHYFQVAGQYSLTLEIEEGDQSGKTPVSICWQDAVTVQE